MSNGTDRSGFTIVEVVIAIVVFTVGVLALASTAGFVTRMVGQSQRYTRASLLANERFEILRSQTCATVANGTATQGAYQVGWTVAPVSGGRGKRVTVTIDSPTARGTRSDSFGTTIPC